MAEKKNDPRQALVAKQKFSVVATPFTAKQYELIYAPTPSNQVFKRPGKGGSDFRYVKGSYVKKRLNWIFGSLWSFEILGEIIDHKQVIIKGKLTILNKRGEPIITKMQFGRADVKFSKATKEPLDFGNDFKSAATDCLKKCASELGICSDVYAEEEKQEFVDQKLKPVLMPQNDFISRIVDLVDNNEKARRALNGIDPFTLSPAEAQQVYGKLMNL